MSELIRLSPEQRADFERDGFLIVRGALSPAEVERYLSIVDRLATEHRASNSLGEYDTIEIRNSVALAPDLLPLLDHPGAFPLIADYLGWNIRLTTSHTFVRTPNPKEEPSFKAIDWHADGPSPRPGHLETANGPAEPLLYAKIGYFLTDLSEPDRGNLRVVPGSHRCANRPPLNSETGDPEGAIQVLTRPGDAVLFENRTWHAVGPNHANVPRKNIYLGYCYRWVQPMDFTHADADLLALASPVQRQLLGQVSNPLSYYRYLF